MGAHSPVRRAIIGKLATASRMGDEAKVRELRQDLKAQQIAELVASGPLLRPEQAEKLVSLLRAHSAPKGQVA